MSDACVLDTHVWVALMQGDRMPRRAQRVIRQAKMLLVPDTCLWEMALLWASGRISAASADMSAERWMRIALGDPCALAPLSPAIAVCSVDLGHEGFHRDPADRLIYATARMMDLPLITRDQEIHAFEQRLPRHNRRLAVWD